MKMPLVFQTAESAGEPGQTTPPFVNGQSLSTTNDWGRVKRAGLTETGAIEIDEVG